MTEPETLKDLQRLSYFLDDAIPIPGTPYRIGIDPLLGLLPVSGDLITGLASAYIVFRAAQLGISRMTLLRMVMNITLDTILGSLPFAGDIFDTVWKANQKNITLLERSLNSPQTGKKADQWFVILVLAGFLLIVLAIALLSLAVLTGIIRAIWVNF